MRGGELCSFFTRASVPRLEAGFCVDRGVFEGLFTYRPDCGYTLRAFAGVWSFFSLANVLLLDTAF